jgi:lipopolysaccharide transport system permease protein
LVERDLAQRYQGAFLGTVWSLIVPLFMLLVYTFVFGTIFHASWEGQANSSSFGQFGLILFAGLTPFNFFSEVVNRGPTLILAVPNYVKKVVFPLEVLPVVAVGTAAINSLISVGLLLVVSLLVRQSIAPTIVLLPLAFLPLLLLCLAASWFLAGLGVYVRDVGQSVGVILQILFFLSPVFYPVSAMPAPFRVWLAYNPLTTILDGFRRVLLWDTLLAWKPWAVWTLVSALAAWLAYAWFMRLKKGFADVL